MGQRTLKNFIKEVDRVAPWFVVSGSFTLPSWNKLGKDLIRAHENDDLRMGTLAIRKLVKNCLQDENCQSVVRSGQITLETVQDSMSETERSERMGARKKKEESPFWIPSRLTRKILEEDPQIPEQDETPGNETGPDPDASLGS